MSESDRVGEQPTEERSSNLLKIDETAAHYRVEDLKDTGIVVEDIGTHTLIHKPTGIQFKEPISLAYFHSGYSLGKGSDSESGE